MPTYEYACTSCGHHLEVSQSFSEDPLTECPSCGGPLRKVFGSIGIVLKGSGFYRTDSRSSSTRSEKAVPDKVGAKGAAGKKEGDGVSSGVGSSSDGPSSNGSTSNGSTSSGSTSSSTPSTKASAAS